MNVTVEQVQTGIGLYIDNELAPHLDGWKKWVFPTVAALYISNLNAIIDSLPIDAIGIRMADGRIDIDKIYAEMKKQAEKAPMTITIPKLNDTFSFNCADVDKLYNYITRGGLTYERHDQETV